MSRETLPVPPPAPAACTAAHTVPSQPRLLFAIEDLAQLFHLEVDSARELTYRADFPQPIKIGRRWLWFPEEVLGWTREQKRFHVTERKRNGVAPEVAVPTPRVKDYTPRKPKSTGVAA